MPPICEITGSESDIYESDGSEELLILASNDLPIVDIQPDESEKERRRNRIKRLADELIANRNEEKEIKEDIEIRHETALNLLLRKKMMKEEIEQLTENIENTFREIERQRERKRELKEREQRIWEEHSDHTVLLMRDYKL